MDPIQEYCILEKKIELSPSIICIKRPTALNTVSANQNKRLVSQNG